MKKIWSVVQAVILFLILIYCVIQYVDKIQKKSGLNLDQFILTQKAVTKCLNDQYGTNNHYMINNNLAQYSAYVIVYQNNITIEAFVYLNPKYVKYFGDKENFTCVLKLLSCDDRKNDAIIELEAVDSPKFFWNRSKKLIFNLDLKLLKNDYEEKRDRDLILKNTVVAIIWKHDYNKLLNNVTVVKDTRILLPYSLINFQIPSIIYSEIPRLKSVSSCVHFAYTQVPYLKQFIDLHLSFGVREIRIYDAVDNRTLTKYLKSIYSDNERITVVPYQISFDDLCNESLLFKQFKDINIEVKEYLKNSCKSFYEKEFENKYATRNDHEQLSSNDCFSVLKQKHEFITYYDLDDFVFPRTLETVKDFNKTVFSCKSYIPICSVNSFQNKFKISENQKNFNYFYNYLQSLIEKNRNGRDVQKLSSIGFSHAAYFIPDHFEKQFINDLGRNIEMYEKNNSINFPLSIVLSEPNQKNGHTFFIQREDINFIKYLYQSYQSLIPCIYNNYLKNISEFTKNAIRHLYYITEGSEAMGKAIHYYKNVKSLFIHYAKETVNDHWNFHAPEADGNFLSHFRVDVNKFFKANFSGSIRKANIDYEYAFFLLKNHTSFCEIK